MSATTKPRWSVVSAAPRKDYTIDITFADGTVGRYDAKPLLGRAAFAPLKSEAFLMLARAHHGTVAWSDDIDIAPEHLYENCSGPQASSGLRPDIPPAPGMDERLDDDAGLDVSASLGV